MQLRELVQGIGVVELHGSLDREITSVVCDIRRVIPGALYIAARTALGDGHEQIEAAVGRGAVAVIAQGRRRAARATMIEVSDSRKALAEVSRLFYGSPAERLRVVGVAGEHGQNTIASVLKQLLENAGLPCALIGSARNEIKDRRLPAGRHFPESPDLQFLLAQAAVAGCEACVVELRRDQFLNGALAGVKLNTMVFANFGAEDRESATQLAKALRAAGPRDQLAGVVNIDEPVGEQLARQGPMEVVLTYGLGERARVRAQNLVLDGQGARFQMQLGPTLVQCRSPLIGRHNVYAILAASGAGLSLGLDPETISRSLSTLPPLPGNLEEVTTDHPFSVYVDGANKPALLAQALKSLREITPGKIILVIGSAERTTSRDRFDLGRAASAADLIILTADNPGREMAAKIASTIGQGCDQSASGRYYFEEDRAQAIMRAVSMGRPGDAVLIAGKGDHSYQEFADTIVPFDDRECARECLERLTVTPVREVHRHLQGVPK